MRIFHGFQPAYDTHLGIHDAARRPIETFSDIHINFTLLDVPDYKRGSRWNEVILTRFDAPVSVIAGTTNWDILS